MTERARVLVVNDDVRLAESVRAFLVQEGYEARVARDGLAAIDALGVWPADVVLLDLMMPRLDGLGFLARRATSPELARSKVVVWSVAPAIELDRALALGASRCLPGATTAPFELADVLSNVLAEPCQQFSSGTFVSSSDDPGTALRDPALGRYIPGGEPS